MVYTDCECLKWLLTRNFEDNPRLFKYQLKLQGYDMAMIYRPGKTNLNADFLSHLPESSPDMENATHALAVTKATTEEAPWIEEPYVPTMSPDTLPDLQRHDKDPKPMIRYLECWEIYQRTLELPTKSLHMHRSTNSGIPPCFTKKLFQPEVKSYRLLY